jgi:outer membrane protein TolC
MFVRNKTMRKYINFYANSCSINRSVIAIGLSITVLMLPISVALGQNLEAVSLRSQQLLPDRPNNILTLKRAIALAQENDDWLLKSDLQESRFQRLSEAADTLPDPSISIGLLNLPTNGFAINQEPMTQFKVGASQMFPRGKSRALTEKRYKYAADEQPLLRENRRQQIALKTTQLWLVAYEASASYKLVNDARPLFDKLGDIVSASYASSAGNANQQDIIRAELELVRLNDRLISLEAQKDVALAQLSQFLTSSSDYQHSFNQDTVSMHKMSMPASIPEPINGQNAQYLHIQRTPLNQLHTLVSGHALLGASEQRIRTASIDIDIAKQAYKPQYGVNASYAWRDDSPRSETQSSQSRADFFSIGLSVSMPLFSNTRQDANVSSATLMTEAMRTEKLLIMRELMAGLKTSIAAYKGASTRLTVYEKQILPQVKQQTQAALNAYTNDIGDFAEVVRAQIDELDAQLTTLAIQTKQRQALAKIDYYYSPKALPHTLNNTGINAHE